MFPGEIPTNPHPLLGSMVFGSLGQFKAKAADSKLNSKYFGINSMFYVSLGGVERLVRHCFLLYTLLGVRYLITSPLCPPPPVKECAGSSPTSYFWFRKALDITNSIDESGEFNPIMTGCLLAAWAIVALGMIKGIKSSARVKKKKV